MTNIKNYVSDYMNGGISLPEAYLALLDKIEDDNIDEQERNLWYNQYNMVMEQICMDYMQEHGYEHVIVDSRYKWVKQEVNV